MWHGGAGHVLFEAARLAMRRVGLPWYAPMLVAAAAYALLRRRGQRRGRRRRHRWRVKAGEDCWQKVRGFSDERHVVAYLRKVEPLKFEEALLSAFRGCGARVQRNRRYSGDGGIDGRFRLNGRRYCVQAKRYAGYIPARHVRDFAAALEREMSWVDRCLGRARPSGVFVHTGAMSRAVRALAEREGIEVVSGHRLTLLFRGDWRPLRR